MKWFILVPLLLTFLDSALASPTDWEKQEREKERLVLSKFQSSALEEAEILRLRSAMVRISAKQSQYYLVLKPDGQELKAGYNLLKLNVEEESHDNWLLEAEISSLKSGKKLKRVYAKNVKRRNIFRKSELVLEALFGLRPRPKENAIKQPPPHSPPTTPSALGSRTAKMPSKDVIDFKSRILAIKKDLPKKIKKQKAAIKQKKNSGKEAKEGRTPSPTYSTVKSKNMAAQEATPEIPSSSSDQKWRNFYAISSNFITQTVNVKDLRNKFEELSIVTNLRFLEIKGNINALQKGFNSLTYVAEVAIQNPITESDIEFDQTMSYALGATLSIPGWRGGAGIRVGQETLLFGSLPLQGGGLQPSSVEFKFLRIDFFKSWLGGLLNLKLGYDLLLEANNTSKHDIPSKNMTMRKWGARAGLKNPYYFQSSYFTLDLRQTTFSNGLNLKGEASSYSLGFLKKF